MWREQKFNTIARRITKENLPAIRGGNELFCERNLKVQKPFLKAWPVRCGQGNVIKC